MTEMRNIFRVLLGRAEERGHLEDLDADDKIILKWILKKQDGKSWTVFDLLRIWTCGGLL
jgi:hypothetical protein